MESPEDVVPLVGATKVGGGDSSKSLRQNLSSNERSPSRRNRRRFILTFVLVVIGAFFVILTSRDHAESHIKLKNPSKGENKQPKEQTEAISENTLSPKSEEENESGGAVDKTPIWASPRDGKKPDGISQQKDQEQQQPQQQQQQQQPQMSPESFYGESSSAHPPLAAKDDYSLHAIKKRFEQARNALLHKLSIDYGKQYFKTLFIVNQDGKNVTLGRTLFGSTFGPSWQRMKRKFMMKILQVQIESHGRRLGDRNSKKSLFPFVWATGGHSAAAGHGNLYNQSYTAVLDRNLKDVFAATGLKFEGRNYAMGGTSSAPNVAWCVEAIFGLDIDVLSWDFGMTDGRAYYKQDLYFHHAGNHPNRPACVVLNVGDAKVDKNRLAIMERLEALGLASFYERQADLFSQIPDSFEKSDGEIMKLPSFLRNFRCDGKVESGEPYCQEEKFTMSICPDRSFRTSWHPGWKVHALEGNKLSLFMMEVLADAIEELASKNDYDPTSSLADLKAQEDKDYDLFFSSKLPEDTSKTLFPKGEHDIDIDIELLYNGRGICKTGLLPAETRYKGILSETGPADFQSYYKGVPKREEADVKPNEREDMRLVYEAGARDRQERQCNVTLNIDHKDFFYVTKADGWQKLILPNDAELQAYGTDEPFRGLIAVCGTGCDWGKCPPGDIREDGLEKDQVQMQVNGMEVTNMTALGGFHDCAFLRNEKGHYWKPNDAGRFEFKALVKEDKSFIRFASVIIW